MAVGALRLIPLSLVSLPTIEARWRGAQMSGIHTSRIAAEMIQFRSRRKPRQKPGNPVGEAL